MVTLWRKRPAMLADTLGQSRGQNRLTTTRFAICTGMSSSFVNSKHVCKVCAVMHLNGYRPHHLLETCCLTQRSDTCRYRNAGGDAFSTDGHIWYLNDHLPRIRVALDCTDTLCSPAMLLLSCMPYPAVLSSDRTEGPVCKCLLRYHS